ncbi:lipid A biosynthesis (KDO) 2-(lauroyl)-lipid IVA acyltransferase [Klebsiella pneumoniae]|nr:lipid A biosynthesis (KDO) 2-(lauroyl)-lipid IVA acyltransferase [Klebsiella pneumoniae]
METKKNNIEFIPKFEKSFLLPRYWGAWLGSLPSPVLR